MTSNSIMIQNPLPFMIERFMKKNVLKGKYSSGKIQYILKDNLPNKILISFDQKNLCESFINDYNEKYFDEQLNYKLKIEKCEKTFEEIQKEISQNITEYEIYKFDIQYEKEWKLDYAYNYFHY